MGQVLLYLDERREHELLILSEPFGVLLSVGFRITLSGRLLSWFICRRVLNVLAQSFCLYCAELVSVSRASPTMITEVKDHSGSVKQGDTVTP